MRKEEKGEYYSCMRMEKGVGYHSNHGYEYCMCVSVCERDVVYVISIPVINFNRSMTLNSKTTTSFDI